MSARDQQWIILENYNHLWWFRAGEFLLFEREDKHC